MRLKIVYPLAAALALTACSENGGSENSASDANSISEDPFGATGAPGADMTDNGVTDGASGLADGNMANEGAAANDMVANDGVANDAGANDAGAPGNAS